MKPKSQLPYRRIRPLSLSIGLLLILAAALAGCSNEIGTSTPPPAPTEAPTETATPVPNETAGIYDDRIVFGQSAALDGPAQELGRNMRRGIKAAFMEKNQQGGVHGRKLGLISLDDRYEPELAVTNSLRLIHEEEVFALIGAVGTPTSRSATPVAAEANVPYVAPFTGAAFLRDPEWKNILNLRSSYYQETEEMVARMTTDLGIERIAVMYQDDSFGRAGFQGALLALERRGMKPAAVGLYPRNTLAVKTALLDLRKADPQGIIIIGAYLPVGTFIAWAKYVGLHDVVFMTVSFVGSNALAEQLGPRGRGVFVTQVVPFPTDTSVPIVRSYLEALSNYDPDAAPGFVSLEGYMAGRLAIASLERCGRQVSRDCFLDILNHSETIEIDEFELQYGPDDNQGSDKVFLTVIGPLGGYHPANSLKDVPP
jgi:ABC-type branched-subunit amino acid transport system substrate-binding protein